MTQAGTSSRSSRGRTARPGADDGDRPKPAAAVTNPPAVTTRLAVLHHHGDELIEMDELARQRADVETGEAAVVTYRCPECSTVVTVGAMTTDAEVQQARDAREVN